MGGCAVSVHPCCCLTVVLHMYTHAPDVAQYLVNWLETESQFGIVGLLLHIHMYRCWARRHKLIVMLHMTQHRFVLHVTS